MRFVNWCLNLIVHLFLLGLLVISARAQASGNGIQIYQASSKDESQTMPASVRSGDCVIGVTDWISNTNSGSETITDSNGIIPSITMETSVFGPNGSSNNFFQPYAALQIFHGVATSSGVVNLTGTAGVMLHHEIPCGNLTQDGPAVSSSTTAPSITTTANNDYIACFTAGIWSTEISPAAGWQWINGNEFVGQTGIIGEFKIAGNAGTYSCQWNGTGTGPFTAIAFKPTNLVVSTSVLPAGLNGVSYSATLTAYGGTGSYSWTRTAGTWPTGCTDASLSSGGVIACTPTQNGTFALTFQASDGTHTASQALSLKIGPALTIATQNSCAGTTDNGSGCTMVGIAGDAFYFIVFGMDQHNQSSWMPPSILVSDTCGDAFVRSAPLAGGKRGAILVWSANITCPGLINVSVSDGAVTGSTLAYVVVRLSNAQASVDPIVAAVTSPGAVPSTTINTSITTVVPNEKILAVTALSCGANGGNVCTGQAVSTNAPFTSVNTGASVFGIINVAQLDAPTAGVYNATGNFTESYNADMSTDTPLMALIPIRQLGVQPVVQNEKIRRYVN